MALLPTGGYNISSTIGTTGITVRKLDISQKIYNLDPTDTPVFEMLGVVPASSRQHDWQTRTLRARGTNAMYEGADYTFRNLALPSRVSNITQIFEDGIELSRSAAKESWYAQKDPMRDQVDLRMIEHRNDQEWNLINSTYLYGQTDSASTMRGLRASITTNVTNALGVTLTETIFVSMLQMVWRNSGVAPDTVLTGEFGQNKINTFNANGATKWIDSTVREVTNQVLVYNSSFASVKVVLCRDVTAANNLTAGSELLFLNRAWNHKAVFEPTFLEPMPKIADAERMVMITEMTFQHDNQKSSAKWQGVA